MMNFATAPPRVYPTLSTRGLILCRKKIRLSPERNLPSWSLFVAGTVRIELAPGLILIQKRRDVLDIRDPLLFPYYGSAIQDPASLPLFRITILILALPHPGLPESVGWLEHRDGRHHQYRLAG
jgi:hypothetical protein